MNYDQIPAGSELDALVAEKVMGWEKHGDSNSWLLPDGHYSGWDIQSRIYQECDHLVWSPSTDISAAWLVVEKLSVDPWRAITICNTLSGWNVQIFRSRSPLDLATSSEDSAPLAICRAALKAHLAAEPPKAGKPPSP